MRTSGHRISQTLLVVVFALLATGAGLSYVFASEALEERRAAAAAMELRHAADAVAAADELALVGGAPDLAMVPGALRELGADPSLALHSLSAADQATATELIAGAADRGRILLSPDLAASTSFDHRQLHQLLMRATQGSSADASAAERQAAVSVLFSVAVLIIGVSAVATSFARASRSRSRTEADLKSGQRIQALLNDSPDFFVVVDGVGQCSYSSQSAVAVFGTDKPHLKEIAARTPQSSRAALVAHLLAPDVTGTAEVFQLRVGSGELRWFDLRVSDLSANDLVNGHLITGRDITAEVELREELQRQATTDVLTGLPNRRTLQSAVEKLKVSLVEGRSGAALLTLDIDGFKVINDTFGHPTGDQLLRLMAARLRKALEGDEMLLRVGGDEFAALLPNVASDDDALAAANRLLRVLDEPFQLGDRTERIRTSIGIAVTRSVAGIDDLVHEADVAMYAAKNRGDGSIIVYQTELETERARGAALAAALRSADYDSEFSLAFQPIVDAVSSEIVSVETLLRWDSPVLGSVSPAEFIPVAEGCGEICAIGNWVIDAVCRQVAVWNEAGLPQDFSVSFNVSARQLGEEMFVPALLSTIEAWGLSPERLVVEVTESTALDHAGLALDYLAQIREAGLRISIDDFGSGYSNLGQLLAVPFDFIKIDRSLLLTLSAMREANGGDPTGSCSIMEAIVSIASVMQAPVVCEGVETELQRASLIASGVTYVQGYLTGRPCPPEHFAQFFTATNVAEAASLAS